MRRRAILWFMGTFAALLLVACSGAPTPVSVTPVVTAPPTPTVGVRIITPTPPASPPKTLTVCLGAEPQDLYLYGAASPAKQAVLDALYDGPIDTTNYGYEPVILEKLPNLADGDAQLKPVTVQPGDTIVDVRGRVTPLIDGVTYFPSGCQRLTCARTYDANQDGAVTMDRLEITFRLLPGVKWSDGERLTADDSVFSFQVAPQNFKKQRTAAYSAEDDHTVRWVGLPGFYDPTYFLNFWTPLPKHRLGKYTAQQGLGQVEEARLRPLGWGPYLLQEWVPGDHLTLARNPYYFRGGQGLPRFEYLVFRFIGQDAATAVDALVAGECDVLDTSIPLDEQFDTLKALADAGKIALHIAPMATTEEFLYFGINPAAYDNGWQYGDRPEILSDPRVRQALAMCIDRQALVDDLYHGLAETSATYLPPQHPLYNKEARDYPYDPQKAQDLLEAANWVDDDGDPATPRVYQGPKEPYFIPQGTPLTLRYLTDTAPFRQKAAQRIAQDLQACGVGVEVQTLPPKQLYQPGPEGPLFGRQFDLAQTAFATGGEPPCLLWTSSFTPGDPNATRGDIEWIRKAFKEDDPTLKLPAFLYGWGGTNLSGYFSLDFDRACIAANSSLEDQEIYTQNHLKAQAIFAEDLPAVPLYFHVKIAASRPDMCGFLVDPTTDSVLWHIEFFDYGPDCQP
ncbi:MAG TPA: peptide ABC transporter substrate-binding protein [Anaerolineae bacterium]|nr:peptide ABC transporter substrate-binding protein [Anaerolineae bacterium]